MINYFFNQGSDASLVTGLAPEDVRFLDKSLVFAMMKENAG